MSRQRISLRPGAGGLLLAAAMASNAMGGSVVFVDDDAPAGGDGTTWDTAYRFLQDALADASGGEVTEIRVGQGTYKPDRDEANPDGTGDREATFQLINGVALMGGYAGLGAKDPDARDIELYETILSGDLLGNDEPDFFNSEENSLHVVTSEGADESTFLDGLTVTRGNADGSNGEFVDKGGGLLCVESDPTIIGCLFLTNRSDMRGGALYLWESTSTLTSCSFISNETEGPASSGRGGAIFANRSASLVDCHFADNFAFFRGGAVYTHPGGDLSLTSCSFVGNIAGAGGAYWNGSADPVFVACTFYNNQASGAGAVGNVSGDPVLIDCEFVGNQATESDGGAVINGSSLGEAFPVFLNCLFAQNSAAEIGGAIRNNRHDLTSPANNPAFVGCVFTGNTAGDNGGAIATASWLTVLNSTISQNVAGQNGGGIYMFHVNPKVIARNSVLWGNTDGNASVEAAQLFVEGDALNVNYSCIQGLTGDLGGVGNIASDPLFVDPNGRDGVPGTADDDFHLLPGSPCINIGDPDPGINIPDADFDGENRLQHCRIDIGVDETPFWFDCNANGNPDACDIAENISEDLCGNGVPDECEVDCNANGIPDQCDVHPIFDIASGELSPFGTGFPQTFLLPKPPMAEGTVNFFFTAHADLSGTSRRIDVELNGEFVGTVFPHEETDCAVPPSADQLIMAADAFNTIVAGGDALVTMLPAGGNMDPDECADGTFVTVQVIYEPEGVVQDCNANETPDECDIADGKSKDCNLNGIPDECDVAALDCNTNGIPDDCDIASGTSQDIDGNGIPDECDEDCNNNGLPDGFDISRGTSADCNDNGIPDECDVLQEFTATSERLGPIGFGAPQSFTILDPPTAVGDVLLSFSAFADLLSVVEFIDVDINGTSVGSVFVKGANDCPDEPDLDSLLVPAQVYNDAIAGDDAVITMTATNAVNPLACKGESYISAMVEIPIQPGSDDDNNNGIPDECETPGDLNGDGMIGVADLLILLSNWGPCADCDDCVADLDDDCSVGVSDLLILLANWG